VFSMDVSLAARAKLAELVMANHILARFGVVDAFGHVSIRHPDRADRYIMSCSRAPEQVEIEDLVEFDMGGRPISDDRPLYAERAIHSEIYRVRPDVAAVCHNHAPATLPFSVTNTPLRPIAHVAAPMGYCVPSWDIREHFGDTDMLVTTPEVAKSLVAVLGDGPTILMTGHGSTVATHDIRATVLTSVYMNENAKLLTSALLLDRNAVRYLSHGEVSALTARQFSPLALERAWNAWAAQDAASAAVRAGTNN
jgi:ribulose-5-phosphate 4-epimerase/fuculose-1-phosphate aldolase